MDSKDFVGAVFVAVNALDFVHVCTFHVDSLIKIGAVENF